MLHRLKRTWEERALPFLVEKACRSSDILARRQRLIPRAEGDVLELGVGSGLNLALYDAAKVGALVGVDVSAALLTKAQARAKLITLPNPPTLLRAPAEALPLGDHSVDTVVMTYTLCSVTDPALALSELRRVLRPQGRLLFAEHGLATRRGLQWAQRGVTPAWRIVGGNCHLDRDIAGLLRGAGFSFLELTIGESEGSPALLSTTYEGVARLG